MAIEFTEEDFGPTFSEADFAPESHPDGPQIGADTSSRFSRARGEAVRSLREDVSRGVGITTAIPQAALAGVKNLVGIEPHVEGQKPLGNRMERQGLAAAMFSASEDSPILAGARKAAEMAVPAVQALNPITMAIPGVRPVAEGASKAISETVGQLAAAPGAVLLGGLGQGGVLAGNLGRIVSGAFTVDMAAGTLAQKAQLDATLADPNATLAQKTEAAINLGISAGMTAGAAGHAMPRAQRAPPVISERPPVIRDAVDPVPLQEAPEAEYVRVETPVPEAPKPAEPLLSNDAKTEVAAVAEEPFPNITTRRSNRMTVLSSEMPNGSKTELAYGVSSVDSDFVSGDLYVDVAKGDAMRGTGVATELYVRAMDNLKESGFGWKSDSIMSESAQRIYRRLIKAGVPFNQLENGQFELSSKDLDATDFASVREKLKQRKTSEIPAPPTEPPVIPEAPSFTPQEPPMVEETRVEPSPALDDAEIQRMVDEENAPPTTAVPKVDAPPTTAVPEVESGVFITTPAVGGHVWIVSDRTKTITRSPTGGRRIEVEDKNEVGFGSKEEAEAEARKREGKKQSDSTDAEDQSIKSAPIEEAKPAPALTDAEIQRMIDEAAVAETPVSPAPQATPEVTAPVVEPRAAEVAVPIPEAERLRRLRSIANKAARKGYEPLTEKEVAELVASGDLEAKGKRKGKFTEQGRRAFDDLSREAEQQRLAEGDRLDAESEARFVAEQEAAARTQEVVAEVEKPAEVRPATPDEVPKPAAESAAPMQKGVSNVARLTSEGAKNAKEAKTQLVEQIGKAIELLGPRDEMKEGTPRTFNGHREITFGSGDNVVTARETKNGWEIFRFETSGETGGRKKIDLGISSDSSIRGARVAAETALNRITNPEAAPSVTIEIPGDGTFTVVNTHGALAEMLRRANGLETSVPKTKSRSQKIIDALESKKIDTKGKVFDAIQGIPVTVWNAALDIAIVGVKAGRTVVEALKLAMAHIKKTHPQVDERVVYKELIRDLNKAQESPRVESPAEPPPAAPVEAKPPVIPDRSPTAINDATIDAERAARGEPPAEPAEARPWEVANDIAAGIEAKDPRAADKLIAEVEAKPRPTFDWENALLLRRKTRLQNEFNAATGDLRDQLSDELLRLERVTRHGGVGTELGRGLASRKMLMNEDFTLASLETQAREAKGGKRLSEPERAELSKLSKDHADAVARADALQGRLDAADALAAVAAAEKSAPTFHPSILAAAERIVSGLERAGEAARQRIREKLAQVSSGVDPTIVADAAIWGAGKLARKGLDFAKWSAEMTADLGDWVKPHLQGIWDQSRKLVENAGRTVSPAVKKATQAVRTASDAIDGAKEKVAAKTGRAAELHAPIRQLVRAIVERDKLTGTVRDREAVIDEIHEFLKTLDPATTRLEAMDAISGRGKFSLPDSAEAARVVRDLAEQTRLVGHQIDVEAGRPLPRTGPQRGAMSDIARREQAKLNELKRIHGVESVDPATQLASALSARKTYARNRIADLRAEIAARERNVKTKTPGPTDAELDAMRKELEEVVREHNEVFGPRDLTDEQRIQIATRAAERSAENWERRLAEAKKGNFDTGAKRAKPVTGPELEVIRARRDAAKSEAQELKANATRKTPEEIQLSSLKARLTRKEARMREQMARNDFSKPAKKPPVKLDREATDALFRVREVEQKWAKQREDWRWDKLTKAERILPLTKKGVNTIRSLLTSFDDSAVGRQGGFLTKSSPLRARNAFKAHIRAAMSDKAMFAEEEAIRRRPNFENGAYKDAGLEFSDLDGSPKKMEEQLRASWAENIPLVGRGVKASQRAFTTYLNVLRADAFDALVKLYPKDGPMSKAELEALGDFINAASGKGRVPGIENSGSRLAALSGLLFAPRLYASRFQMILGQPMWRGTARTRKIIAREYVKYAAAQAIIRGLTVLAGGAVVSNVLSSDSGKSKFGNMRVDPTGGLNGTLTFLARVISGKTINAKGEIKPIRGDDVPYGATDTSDVLWRFLIRQKLAPAPSAIAEFLTGKNAIGKPVTKPEAIRNLLIPTPMIAKDVYEAAKEEGLGSAGAAAILSFFGEGVSTYDSNAKWSK